MPMGCSSSCKTFEAFSTATEWIAQDKLGIANLLHLLDDFILIQPTEDQCSTSLRLFLDLCDFLGINLLDALEKVCVESRELWLLYRSIGTIDELRWN